MLGEGSLTPLGWDDLSAEEKHLLRAYFIWWPEWYHLIKMTTPPTQSPHHTYTDALWRDSEE